jgi:hypothetical protein
MALDPGPGSGQAQNVPRDKLVNGISTLPTCLQSMET